MLSDSLLDLFTMLCHVVQQPEAHVSGTDTANNHMNGLLSGFIPLPQFESLTVTTALTSQSCDYNIRINFETETSARSHPDSRIPETVRKYILLLEPLNLGVTSHTAVNKYSPISSPFVGCAPVAGP